MPLKGTKGCINYNPILAQRKIGYPIKGSPLSFVLKPLLLLYEDGFVAKILPRIRQAWKKVVPMERDSRPCALDDNVAYRLWLAERVRKVKLPFKSTSFGVIREELVTDEEPKEVI